MSNPLIYSIENFIIMEPGKKEEFLNFDETLEWIEEWLRQMEVIPADLKKYKSLNSASKHLLNTACELEIKPGFSIQWFAVRLDPDES